ncbi:LysR family transcriptional regulator [Alicycliphilus denitrificans]|uniref:LysR family transcriptional regulator n=1 Tax=Alicycliphilus denitrificans TaxID=179636 RepID=UPI003A801BE2
MNITFRQLEVFLAVFRSGSFTAAANKLHVTQSAASKMIAELESQLGLPLFERTTRRVIPSSAATEFYRFALDVTATMETAKRSVQELITLERGKVSVAASPLMLYGFLSSVIAGYRRRFPGIDFEIFEYSTDETIESVMSGTVDFGFCATDTRLPDIQSSVILENAMHAIVGREHVLARRKRVRLKELVPYNYISLRGSYSIRRSLDQVFASTGIGYESHIEVGTLTAALGFVKEGAGFLIAPGYTAAIASQWGMQTLEIVDLASFRHRVSLIRRCAQRLSVSARSFQSHLQQSFPLLQSCCSAARAATA